MVCSLPSFSQTIADEKISSKTDNYFAPTLTATEISRRVLKLIKSIDRLDKISPKNLEKIIGGKVDFNEKQTAKFGGIPSFGVDIKDYLHFEFSTYLNRRQLRLFV